MPGSCIPEGMLDLYTWHTPNGTKPAILLAELEVPYVLHLVDLTRGEQKRVDFLELNPNGKIPVLVDRDEHVGCVVVFESGAVLQYLAEKFGRFLPHELGGKRAAVLSWLYWQVTGPAPMFGLVKRFARATPRDDAAFGHFVAEAKRLVGVFDARLEDREFVCDEYSIADIAAYPWFEALAKELPEALEGTQNLHHWLKRMGHRPGVKLGMRLEQVKRAA